MVADVATDPGNTGRSLEIVWLGAGLDNNTISVPRLYNMVVGVVLVLELDVFVQGQGASVSELGSPACVALSSPHNLDRWPHSNDWICLKGVAAVDQFDVERHDVCQIPSQKKEYEASTSIGLCRGQ